MKVSRSQVATLALLLLSQIGCGGGLEPNDIASVTVSPETLTLAIGHAVQLAATARASDGAVVSGRPVSWRSSDQNVATVDASGLVQPLSPGQATINAAVGGTSGSAMLTVITPGGTLRLVSGPTLPDTVTDTLPEPLVVRVRDQDGVPRPGIPVTFNVIDGSAELDPGITITDNTGLGSTVMVLGNRAGSVTVLVTAEGVAESVTFIVFALPDAPARLVSASGDGQSAFTGRTLLSPIAAGVEDRFANRIPGVSVEWAATAGGGSPGANATTTDGNGVAMVTWTLGVSAGANTMEARVAGVVPAVFSALAAVPGPGTITFSSSGVFFSSVLQNMQPDGAGQAAVPGSVVGDIDPDRSHDGTRLVFANYAANANQPSGFNDFADLVAMNANGTGRTRLTDHFGSVSGPARSPDGSKIAFASDMTGRSEIYVMDADGSNVVQLTTTGGYAPSWAPDGSRIAVGMRIANAVPQPAAFVMDANGGNVLPLVPGEDPAWSPDGSRIALATCQGVCDPEDYRLELIHPDGTGAITVGSVSGAHEPAWAPDGSKIALRVVSSNGFADGLWTINPDGSGPVRLDLLGALPSWGF